MAKSHNYEPPPRMSLLPYEIHAIRIIAQLRQDDTFRDRLQFTMERAKEKLDRAQMDWESLRELLTNPF